MKINFIVAGTQKGGTTALHSYLRENTDLSMASKKEVHFFDHESYFSDVVNDSQYHSFFDLSINGKLRGEATPIYLYWYPAPKRIWQYNPEMKFILILRNPIERAYSHWNMERDRGNDNLPFLQAIKTEEERCKTARPLQHRIFSYIDRGFYTDQLRRLWHFFPKKQILIIKSEELKESPHTALSKVATFLQISDFQNIQKKEIHARPYLSKMTDEEREYLKHRFFYSIKELEQILDWDCSDWLDEH